MLAEIGDYQELSANRDQDWLHDAGAAADWMEQLWRVMDAPPNESADDIIAPLPDDADDPAGAEPTPADSVEDCEQELAVAAQLSLPPRFMALARAAQDSASWSGRMLADESLPVRLAVYLKMLGSADDSYPADWLDPATGELPTMAQLAALDRLSLPTLRKRRDAAIARLLAASAP